MLIHLWKVCILIDIDKIESNYVQGLFTVSHKGHHATRLVWVWAATSGFIKVRSLAALDYCHNSNRIDGLLF